MSKILALLSLVCLSLPIGYAAGLTLGLVACHGSVAVEAKQDAAKVWDCTAPKRAALVEAVAPLAVQLLDAAIDAALHAPYPDVDYGPTIAALDGLKDNLLPCVVAVATGSVLSRVTPQVSLVGKSGANNALIRRSWERLRVERFGSATFLGVVGL